MIGISRLERLLRERAARRRLRAAEAARCALEALNAAGVDAVIVGSLAHGRFQVHSDVDYLIRTGNDDAAGRTGIERVIAACMEAVDIPYDILFRQDLPDDVGRALEQNCLDACGLRETAPLTT
jgi:predicted nucleotidyltransferase